MPTYYVSNGGNDTNGGQSSGDALATIAEGLSRMLTGDTLLLERGSTWNESATIAVTNSVFDAYGSGALPRIVSPSGTAITTSGAATNVRLSLLDIQGDGASDALVLTAASSTTTDCNVSNTGNRAVLVQGDSIRITKCSLLGNRNVTFFTCTDGTLDQCTITNNDNVAAAVYCHGAGTVRHTIEKNLILNTGSSTPATSANAIHFDDDGAGDATIRWNRIEGTWYNTIYIRCTGDNVVYGNVIYISSGNGSNVCIRMVAQEPATTQKVYANTVYFDRATGDASNLTYGNDVDIKNNIFLYPQNIYYVSGATSAGTFTADRNYYWLGTRSRPFNASSPTPNSGETFANHQTHTGQDSNSAEADPQLEDASGGDLWPQEGSPVIGAGVSISGFDERLDARSTWPNNVILTSSTSIGSFAGPLVSGDPPVPYTEFVPANLRRCWHDASGNLKPSCTTALYTSGNPTNVNQLKPSIADHATGNLKSGITIGGDLKPSMKPVP